MAELHIEKKRRSTGLWIAIGLVLAALLAWMLMRPQADDRRTDAAAPSTGALPTADAMALAALTPGTPTLLAL